MATIANITVNMVENNPSIKIVNASGELDESNLPEFENAVNPLIQDVNNKTVIFNFDGLEFMSSKIIGYLASTFTTLQRDQRTMILSSYNQTIADILELVGLNQLVSSYPTLEEAIQAVAGTATGTAAGTATGTGSAISDQQSAPAPIAPSAETDNQ